jgi:hypothetical protein
LAEPCTYQPPSGAPVFLRAVISAADLEAELFLTGALTGRYRAMVRVGDVPAPVEGAHLAVASADGGGLEHAGTTFVVRKFLLDAEGTAWTLGLDIAT